MPYPFELLELPLPRGWGPRIARSAFPLAIGIAVLSFSAGTAALLRQRVQRTVVVNGEVISDAAPWRVALEIPVNESALLHAGDSLAVEFPSLDASQNRIRVYGIVTEMVTSPPSVAQGTGLVENTPGTSKTHVTLVLGQVTLALHAGVQASTRIVIGSDPLQDVFRDRKTARGATVTR